MLQVSSLLVRSFDLDSLTVFWEIDSTQEELEQYDFYVLRSIDGAAGPFHVAAGPFYNTYMFRDIDVHQLHKWRTYFYKVRVVHRPSGDIQEFGPAFLQAPPDLIAMEIQRRNRLLFQEYAGRLVLLYPALTFGQRCKHCWDAGKRGNSIGRATQQNCSTCFDTTYVGGYASPVAIYLQIDPSTNATQRTDTVEMQPVETSARTWAFPPLKSKDLIVELENIRWRIEAVSSTQKLRAVVRQELKLRQYPKSDIKYTVPVNLDLLTKASPLREYSRLNSLQAEPLGNVQDIIGSDK